ncbi:phosphotransferase family protein [Propioniciclava soli]|uniref:Phosphotransferase n=1 Tax=Propioniciclava soli TaxID=2775081 RepID=A0ABZ3CAE9_9ACTN|nr:phosphotransferase [Propioniciclava soli]
MQTVVDDIVVTRHPLGTPHEALAARLAAAASDPLRTLYAAPLADHPITAPNGQLLTLAPRTEPLPMDEEPPWQEAGRLLAHLHRTPPPPGLPEHGGHSYLQVAVDAASGLHPGGATDILRELGASLLAQWPDPPRPSVVHGDWDLGNLGRLPGTTTWLLTGPETLGLGDPGWDLGRPAGLWAAGLLDDASWRALLRGYAEAGGVIPHEGEAWNALEHPARCAVFTATVREVGRSGASEPRTELADTLLEACVKMNGRRW